MKVYPIEKPGKKKKKKRGLPLNQRNKVYQEVIERDVTCQNPFCESGWPLDWPHHIAKKGQYGLDVTENLTLMCVECHRVKLHQKAFLTVSGRAPDNLSWWHEEK